MNTAQLLKPIFDGGIRSINFFNGRVLSGEDLSQEQAANWEEHRLLGEAIGQGIVYGLEVSKTPAAGTQALVNIAPGVAINREGHTVQLPVRVTLSLVYSANGGAAGQSPFAACQPFQGGVYVAGTGVYLLTISPAEGRQGRASVSGLGNTNADCNAKYLVEGVQFRLTQLDLTPEELNDQDHLRNLVAYKCFGVEELRQFAADPLGTSLTSYGLLDTMRPKKLGDCEVPLAVLHWTATEGIKFVDLWSVRRPLIALSVTDRWSPVVGCRRAAEGLAIFLQFQSQLAELVQPNLTQAVLTGVEANQYFHYLPAAGLLPVSGALSPGFDATRFFDTKTHRSPVFIEGAKLEPLIRCSFSYPAVDLKDQEMIWLYWVRQNLETTAEPASTAQAYLLFTNGHIPYEGKAQFDLNYWDYANFL